MKVCGKCNELLPDASFYKRVSGALRSWCRACHKERVLERHHNNKKLAVDYKGGRCVRCGYVKCIAALEFHHLDPLEKDKQWKSLRSHSFERLKIELDKCILLCANCHREIHN